MGLFNNMLKDGESLFRDTVALDYDYIPKLVPFRESEQKHVASCVQPLFMNRNGKNVFVYGAPGIGKTVALKHVLRELEEETDDIEPVYINCWQSNTTYKVMVAICDAIGFKFTQNKKTEDLMKVIADIVNKKSIVLVFDEIDKAEDTDFLYWIVEQVYRKTIILITNYKEWLYNLDERLKSRMIADLLEFKAYNALETKEILKHRLKYAFVEGVWEDDAFNLVANKAAEMKDIRSGLYLMKEAGNIAENKSQRKITIEYAQEAIKKLEDFTVKKKEDLEEDNQEVLKIIKDNNHKKIGDLFKIYQEQGGSASYKTFQRKISKLAQNKFITVEKTSGGAEGNTTIVHYSSIKKLNEF